MKFSPSLTKRLVEVLGTREGYELINRIRGNSINPADAKGRATAAVANTYVGTFNPPLTSLVKYDHIYVDFASTNTGAATLNTDGLGAYSIYKQGNVELAAADIDINVIYSLIFAGASWQITL
ncbi:hypothetical protein LCGC14_2793800 [marine sediment metagenome]|uniref:Uncharacterized protein n=1 Tax=marine sediment metagenome TaxID=412755 RepID=A0A0F9BG56_9ZZZZ